jgi:acyl-CoA reductase-like NAD-dependent aldehyde dehydrogenase
VALFINAFNFPSWGLWEKAAPALLSGVPVVVKPATATAWLTQRMVQDVVDAGFAAGRCPSSAAARPVCWTSAAVRRGVVHRLGRHGGGDPLAPGGGPALGAREHRGRQRQLGPAAARRGRRQPAFDCW